MQKWVPNSQRFSDFGHDPTQSHTLNLHSLLRKLDRKSDQPFPALRATLESCVAGSVLIAFKINTNDRK